MLNIGPNGDLKCYPECINPVTVLKTQKIHIHRDEIDVLARPYNSKRYE